jgi:hypothetical protein
MAFDPLATVKVTPPGAEDVLGAGEGAPDGVADAAGVAVLVASDAGAPPPPHAVTSSAIRRRGRWTEGTPDSLSTPL